MNKDKEFQTMFTYNPTGDWYISQGNNNKVLLWQIGLDYIVTTYRGIHGDKSYMGNNLDKAISTAVQQAKFYTQEGR